MCPALSHKTWSATLRVAKVGLPPHPTPCTVRGTPYTTLIHTDASMKKKLRRRCVVIVGRPRVHAHGSVGCMHARTLALTAPVRC